MVEVGVYGIGWYVWQSLVCMAEVGVYGRGWCVWQRLVGIEKRQGVDVAQKKRTRPQASWPSNRIPY
jgi:hypothetical protein